MAKKPASLSHEEAAAVLLAGGTAYEVLFRRLAVSVGETVLIHEGAGGVGSFAIQIARADAGPDNKETLEDLGAAVAIDYRSQDVAEVALDETAGGDDTGSSGRPHAPLPEKPDPLRRVLPARAGAARRAGAA